MQGTWVYKEDGETDLEFQLRAKRQNALDIIAASDQTDVSQFSKSIEEARVTMLDTLHTIAVPIARLCPDPVDCVNVYDEVIIDWFEQDIKGTDETASPFDQLDMILTTLKNDMDITVLPVWRCTNPMARQIVSQPMLDKRYHGGQDDTCERVYGDWHIKLDTIGDPPKSIEDIDRITCNHFHHAILVQWIQTEASKKHGKYIRLQINFDPNKVEQYLNASICRKAKRFRIVVPDQSPYGIVRYKTGHTLFYQKTPSVVTGTK